MATFEITGPDGTTYQVEGATEEGAARAVAQMAGGGTTAPVADDAPLTPTVNGDLYNAGTGQTVENRDPGPQRDRFGDTIEDATEGPIAAFKAFGSGVMDSEQSPTRQMLPDWVPENARGPVAFAGDVGGAALSAAGSVYGFGAGLVGEALGGSPTNERKLARDLMMMGEVAAPELSGVSSAALASGKVAKAAKSLERQPTALEQSARSADDLGVTPSLGAGGKGRSMTAGALEGVPLAGSQIARDNARFVGEIESAFDGAVSRIGKPASALTAGEKLKTGVDKFVVEFKEKSKELFDDVGRHMPAQSKVSAPSTVKYLRETIAEYGDSEKIASELGLPRLEAVADDLERGLTWKALSDFRSAVGESLSTQRGALNDISEGRAKQIYARLSEDMATIAQEAGPAAEKSFKRAQNYYRRGAERIEKSLDKTIRADSPERAFEAFVNMTKADRASSDARRMFQIKASVPREDWNDISASIIDRLGKSRPGAQNAAGDEFSPAVFLTEWNKMSPEAKSVLLSGEARKEMNKLAEVAELAKSANAERNASRTGNVVVGAGLGASATQAPISTAAFLLGSWGSAKALTSPRMLRALNKAARGDSRQLRVIARDGGPLAQDARTILRLTAAESAATSSANSPNEPLYRRGVSSVSP
ncbi:hypothetical protein [Roseovarius sp. MMSF_3350]|uniref:hypothetical protein n=1 Tax=Roseovarius sp. MMSF_3350 TaxID=3046706 RepID=UPI00273DCFC4|nr:hypothetical protein [Roseovarius sp. MMSF_3350]